MWYPPSPGGPLGAFSVNRDSVQAQGLVAWWPTVRQRGAVLRDYAGRLAPAAWPGGAANPTRAPQPLVEEALSFNGSAQYADTGKSFSQANMNPITVACWLRPLASAGADFAKAAVAQDADTGGRAFTFGQAGTGSPGPVADSLYLETNGAVSSSWLSGAAAMALGAWYHGAWTFDGTTFRLYQNGQQVSSGTITTPPAAATTLTIGRRNYTGFEGYFNGHIADVRLYNRALPPSVIAQLWDAPTRWALYQPVRQWGGGRGTRVPFDPWPQLGPVLAQ